MLPRYALAFTLTTAALTGCTPATPAPEGSTIAAPPSRTSAAASVEEAASRCGLEGSDGVQLEAATLTIDTKGRDETSGAAMEDVSCVLNAFEVPESIRSEMTLSTIAEVREASWEGRTYSWDFDPDTWFQLSITEP